MGIINMTQKIKDPVKRDLQLLEIVEDVIDYKEKSAGNLSDLITSDDLAGGLWSSEIKAWMQGETLKSLFFNDDWVFILVDLVAQKISKQRMKVYKTTKKENRYSTEEVPDHPLNARLSMPNAYQDYHAWMYSQIVEYTLMGNDVNWISKNEIIVLGAERVTMNFKQNGELKSYTYITKDSDGNVDKKRTMEFPAEQVVHVRRPNPCSMLWGLSPFIPGRKSILFNRYSADYLNQFYLRNALPGIALKMDEHVNEQVALRLLRSFESAYTGRRNQRRTMILPKGVSAQEMSHTIADQNLIELIDRNRETIINILKVPKHELSLASVGSLGSEENKMSLRNFWSSTLIPTMKMIAGSWTNYFQEELGKDHFFKFDLSDVEVLQDDVLKKAKLAREMLATHTLNEVRAALYSLAPLEDGDFTPATESTVGQNNDNNIPLEPQGSIDESELSVDDVIVKAVMNKYADHIDYSLKKLDEEVDREQDGVLDQVFNIYSETAASAIDALVSEFKSKADDDKKLLRIRRKIDKAVDNLEEDWLDFHQLKLGEASERSYKVITRTLTGDFDEAALEAIKRRRADGRKTRLHNHGIEAFQNFTKTSTDKAMDIITDGLKRGRNVRNIADDLVKKFTDDELTIGTAERIARTEILTAASIGKYEATKDLAELLPNMKKVWITAKDDAVRGNPSGPKSKNDHFIMEAKVVDFDKPFKMNTGEDMLYPRDPQGSAGQVINCRCDFIAIPADKIPDLSI